MAIVLPQTPEAPHSHPVGYDVRLQTVTARATQSRFINRYDGREILILVNGSCINNGTRTEIVNPPSEGCSFTYKGPGRHGPSVALPFQVGFPLEKSGPGADACDATSNRAQLRALEFRAWQEEGWRRIVVATDLEYVVFSATRWLPQWVHRRWRTRKPGRVANRDLWEELNGIIENSVAFWLLPPGKRGQVPVHARA
ncbi:hypothetical protein GGR53DRAFT_509443 [Hypoxylon sp. FL1150]|nr:hypothetical protein GGR53DRAFT_509443 [Hypoxylon sp. FL1150]